MEMQSALKCIAATVFATSLIAGSLCAAETNKTAAPGTCDLSRFVAANAQPGGRTTLRDASGHTLGTATTAGSQTTFRDPGGRTTGSATVEGNRTVFRDGTGRTVGTAMTSGRLTTYRDATGRTQATSSESQGRTTFREPGGRTSLASYSRACARGVIRKRR